MSDEKVRASFAVVCRMPLLLMITAPVKECVPVALLILYVPSIVVVPLTVNVNAPDVSVVPLPTFRLPTTLVLPPSVLLPLPLVVRL